MDFGFIRNSSVFKAFFPRYFNFSATNTNIFILLVGVIFIATVLKNICQYVAVLNVSFLIRRFSNILRQAIFDRYISFGKMFFDRNNTGYLQTILISFTQQVSNQLKGLVGFLSSFLLFFVYLLLMVIISWRITIFVILIFPVLNYAFKWLISKIRKSSEYYTKSYAILSNNIANVLTCIPLVKLYSNEEFEKKRFYNLSNEIEKIEFSLDKKQNLVTPMHEIILLTSTLLLVSAITFIVVRERVGDVASFLVFLFILKRSAASFGNLNDIKAGLATISGHILALVKIINDDDKFIVPDGNVEFTGLKKSIEFKNLTFSYINEVIVLKGITFSIARGSKVAFVGPTGTGKTTLINLLLRFYDCSPDAIEIDGIDIRDYTLKSLRNHISLVSQDTLLFNDTIKNNILYGLDRSIPDEELVDVLKRARLYNFVVNLPDSFNTAIGDRGIKLSGGEKQRLSIARAMLNNAELLILDEATSSLDIRTEKLIQEAIDEVMKNRTTIVIAHRFFTIKNSEKIIVIEDGKLIEQGSLNELLERKGKFYTYWQEQKFY
ncbi:MAG: ABC transporter ATP-binding protein [Candidatus Omnitrophica bacterium]|nr:ABC transporter ATP-binding protein [Candidatus Omnitrophota bacterium]